MDNKEVRTKCIEFAFRYIDYYARVNSTNTYKTETGVVAIAQRFEKYIDDGE